MGKRIYDPYSGQEHTLSTTYTRFAYTKNVFGITALVEPLHHRRVQLFPRNGHLQVGNLGGVELKAELGGGVAGHLHVRDDAQISVPPDAHVHHQREEKGTSRTGAISTGHEAPTVDTGIPFSARHFEYSTGYSTYIPRRQTAIGWPTVDSGACSELAYGRSKGDQQQHE
eukprot:1182527-Prorocentrum_minimum.AAC.1